jgi:Family of unknown function (DUF6252)
MYPSNKDMNELLTRPWMGDRGNFGLCPCVWLEKKPMQLKKLFLPGLLLGFALSTLFSCRKEDVTTNSSSADSLALFSATIAGSNWQTDSVSAFLVNEYPKHYKIMTITGYTSNRVITISLKDTAQVGSNDSTMRLQEYDINNWMPFAEFSYANNWINVGRNWLWQQQGPAYSGQATVTASDGIAKTISGTFSFIAQVLSIDSTGLNVDTVNVSYGVFKHIPYTYFHHQ